jgi:hypothetical protein
MNKRPLTVTAVGWLFIAAGAVGLIYHVNELSIRHPFASDTLWVAFVRLLAVLCGVFVLRGRNWARFGVVIWMAYHVALSVLHSPLELAVHAILLAAITYLLFRRQATAYFRSLAPLAATVEPNGAPDS